MTKRLIDVDDDKLELVRTLLGTRTLRATVDAAFDEVLALERRWRALLADHGARDDTLADPVARQARVALTPYYLGDTSVLARSTHPAVAERLLPLLEAGLVARCSPTDLEAGSSSRGPAEHRRIRDVRAAWPFIPMDQQVLDRAVEVQNRLAERSQQRGAKIADLLIAAAAESAGLVVLHYDHVFDLIAEVTGQPTDWILRPGTVP